MRAFLWALPIAGGSRVTLSRLDLAKIDLEKSTWPDGMARILL
jgi:hypothetical protein